MNEIYWPAGYLPGTTDNFASNEVIAAGLSAADVWPFLSHAPLWPTYYANSADIRFHDGKGPELAEGVRFDFTTFGFPVEALVMEYVAPLGAQAGRVAWHGWGVRATHASTCTTRGWWRTCRAAECASLRRKHRRAHPLSTFQGPGRT
jgi:hypothetical protein